MMRLILNLRSTPLERPVSMQRLCDRVGDESRGRFANAHDLIGKFLKGEELLPQQAAVQPQPQRLQAAPRRPQPER